MITSENITSLQELLPSTSSIIIALGKQPTFDQVAAASSLFLSLTAAGKQAWLVAPTEPSDDWLDLAGMESWRTEVGNQDLTISFPYQPEVVDKVSYHIDEASQRFLLVVKPQAGHSPLDAHSVEFQTTGAQADLIITVGVAGLDDLGYLAEEYPRLFEESSIVTLHTFAPEYGNIKIDVSGHSSVSEAVAGLLPQVGLPMSPEIGTNLLAGVDQATQSFTSLAATADTFAVAAELMRQGARRIRRNSVSVTSARPVTPSLPQQTFQLQQSPAQQPQPQPRQSARHQRRQKSTKPKNQSGDLTYQPGAEGNVGRG